MTKSTFSPHGGEGNFEQLDTFKLTPKSLGTFWGPAKFTLNINWVPEKIARFIRVGLARGKFKVSLWSLSLRYLRLVFLP